MKLHVDPASCRAYGLCKEKAPDLIDLDEWGYASLAELQSLRVRGLTMERDLHFPIALRTVKDALARVA